MSNPSSFIFFEVDNPEKRVVATFNPESIRDTLEVNFEKDEFTDTTYPPKEMKAPPRRVSFTFILNDGSGDSYSDAPGTTFKNMRTLTKWASPFHQRPIANRAIYRAKKAQSHTGAAGNTINSFPDHQLAVVVDELGNPTTKTGTDGSAQILVRKPLFDSRTGKFTVDEAGNQIFREEFRDQDHLLLNYTKEETQLRATNKLKIIGCSGFLDRMGTQAFRGVIKSLEFDVLKTRPAPLYLLGSPFPNHLAGVHIPVRTKVSITLEEFLTEAEIFKAIEKANWAEIDGWDQFKLVGEQDLDTPMDKASKAAAASGINPDGTYNISGLDATALAIESEGWLSALDVGVGATIDAFRVHASAVWRDTFGRGEYDDLTEDIRLIESRYAVELDGRELDDLGATRLLSYATSKEVDIFTDNRIVKYVIDPNSKRVLGITELGDIYDARTLVKVGEVSPPPSDSLINNVSKQPLPTIFAPSATVLGPHAAVAQSALGPYAAIVETNLATYGAVLQELKVKTPPPKVDFVDPSKIQRVGLSNYTNP